jgi:citrate synthase
MSADEAAKALGITRATLYAYVSRRGIRSSAVPGSRERRYWRSDILQAKRSGRGPQAGGTKQSLPESAITLSTPGELYYRGIPVVDLAEDKSFEDVVALLVGASVEQVFGDRLPVFPPIIAQIDGLLADAGGMDRSLAILPLIEAANPRAYDLSDAGVAITAGDVLRSLTAVMFRLPKPATDPIHLQIQACCALTDDWADLVRRMLILSADHGFEASTIAVRGVASIGVSAYRSVAAGLLLAAGRRTKFGRIDIVHRLLTDLMRGDPETVMVRRMREGDALPGFGYQAFDGPDPRATALLQQLDRVCATDESYSKLRRAVAIVHDALGLHPDFALISAFAASKIVRDPRDSLFLLGRCAGWMAHAAEQYRSGETVRPQSIYTGQLPA